MSCCGASWYPDKWDRTTLLVSREWTVSLKKCIRFISHNLLNLGLQFILLVSMSLRIPPLKEKEKEGCRMRSFSFSKLHLCLAYQQGRLSYSTSLTHRSVHRCIDFLKASLLLLRQEPVTCSKLLVNSLTLCLCLCFPSSPPSPPVAGRRRITVESPTLLWSEQVSLTLWLNKY